MKKIILIAISAAALSAYALPTYEPFTEYASQIASNPTNLFVTDANGNPLGANASCALTNCLDLATGGYAAPGGEQWGVLSFSGTLNPGSAAATNLRGLDIAVVTNNNIFTSANLTGLFPAGFPGIPASAGIAPIVENPAQPFILYNGKFSVTNYVGNSAVLHFAQDITRPTSGTKTLFVSYLLDVAQLGQLGTGNEGRYLAFLSSTNLSEGWTNNPPGPLTGAAYTNYSTMFNTLNGTVHYAGHGLLEKSATTYYLGACDSSAGKNWSTTVNVGTFGSPVFVVGEYVLNSGATADQNIVWMNPATTSFGGPTPPSTSTGHAWTMAFNMTDLGGLALEDRPGNGMAGGVGTNYIANLCIGSTWSYVTGGPEFTNQPPAYTATPLGGTASITGLATAAGQNVTYQWYDLTTGSNAVGSAGSTLTILSFSSANVGNYVLVATATGTGLALASTTATLALADPQVTVNPAPATVNFNGTATFTATATTSNPQLTYGWWHNGAPLQNGTLPGGSQTVAVNATGTTAGSSPYTITLTLNTADYLAAGSYYLVVTNSASFLATSTAATLTVNDPVITSQPANPAVAAGGTATFTVQAAGSPTLSYNWYEGTPPTGTQLTSGNATASGAIITITPGSGNSTLAIGGGTAGVQDADDGSYYCAVSGSASLQTAYSATATLTVQDHLTIVTPPVSLAERVGDHCAFTVGVTGGGPQFQWDFNSNPIAGATTSALVLTNITTGSNGTYSVTVQNLATSPQTFNATLTVINSTILPLATNNVVVARVGDGAQTLSGATGNTIYLDQYTNNGTSVIYVNTIQVPDEATGSPYPTGGASSLPGSPALLVQGAGSDAANEAMLTLSGVNQEYLGFAGYCQQYPYTGGSDVTVANLNTGWRGLATVNAYGIYSLAYTNYGLYSGGNHTIRSMVTLDGTNFWTTGQASGGTVKYVNGTPGELYATGNQVPSSTGVSGAGGQVVQIVNGALPPTGFSSVSNLVVSDTGDGANNGLYAAVGTPEPVANNNVAFTALLYTGGGLPADFAFSPDNNTIYVAEAGVWTGSGPGTGGIERWDSNGSGWTYNYTLPVLPGSATNGAQGLTVNWNGIGTWNNTVVGATIYATSTGAAANSLVQVVDNGNPNTTAPTITVVATAGAKQALRGVRFGPAAIAPSFANALPNQSTDLGNGATFASTASGSAPLFYQWYFEGRAISGATLSSFTTNNLSYASAGTYSLVASNLTGLTATNSALLTVTAGAPTITPTPLPSYTETAGDHLAWGPSVTGTLPITYFWYFNNTLLQTSLTNGLTLTDITTLNNGTYKLVVSNLYGTATASGTLTVTAARQNLSSNNLVVARIGDGAQALSAVTGNTLYLDQYGTNGTLVSTIQIPDEGAGEPYGAGSSTSTSMPFGSPGLLFAGGNVSPGNDAGYEAFLTLAPNGETLSFAGYCQAYPFAGPDVSFVAGGNGGTDWRGIATVDAYGYYSLVYTNTGLYSGGNHQIHAAVDIDGNSTNFYTTGEAGSGNSIKYLATSFQPANGMNIVYIAGSYSGTRVAQIIQGNLVFSDVGASPIGIWGCAGIPNAAASSAVLITEGNTNSPMDFAASPDLQTVYIADNTAFYGTGNQAGGIQRWDANGTGQLGFPTYAYSYTLGTGTGSGVGARGLTVDFATSGNSSWGLNVHGAILYATTAEASGNRLIKIVDTGASSSATVLATAGPSQMLAGVRFGPTVIAPNFALEPQNETVAAGSNVTFTADALGSGPLTYQWYFQAGCSGVSNAIPSGTNATYTIAAAGSGNVGCYYVVVTNPGGLIVTSSAASFALALPIQFVSETYLGPGQGFQLGFTGPAGSSYSILTTTDVSQPVETQWSLLTSGTFGTGTNTVTDSFYSPSSSQQFYIITSP